MARSPVLGGGGEAKVIIAKVIIAKVIIAKVIIAKVIIALHFELACLHCLCPIRV